MQIDPSRLKVEIHRDRWNRQGRRDSAVAAAHLVHQGQPVDCYAEIAEEYTRRLDVQPTDRVLEVGCGSGCLLLQMQPRCGEIVGTDFSAGMLQHLEGKSILTQCCEANSLPFPDASFDKVYCHGVVQYFPDETYAQQALEEMLRVCRAGGRVLVGDVINGLLERQYREDGLRTNHRGVKRLRKLILDSFIRPLYYRRKFGGAVDTKPLCLTPFFFKRLLADGPHRWAPMLETVESKPVAFLSYRYDVLIEKDGAQRNSTIAWSA
jgi:SAM-dependent methyltransferase